MRDESRKHEQPMATDLRELILDVIDCSEVSHSWGILDLKLKQETISALQDRSSCSDSIAFAIIELLIHPDADVRARAATILRHINGPKGQIVNALIAALSDPNDDVRIISERTLRTINCPEEAVVRPLIESLEHPDPEVRLTCGKILSRLPGPLDLVISAWIKALESKYVEIRESAARALGGFGTLADAAISPLQLTLYDSDVFVSEEAGVALAQIGRAAIPALIEVLNPDFSYQFARNLPRISSEFSRFEKVVVIAASALGRAGNCSEAVVSALVEILICLPLSDVVAQSATAALGSLGATAALEKLFSEDGYSTVRSRAMRALGVIAISDKGAVQTLLRALEDEDGEVRVAAAEALWRLGEHPGLALRILLEALATKWGTASDAAFDALRGIGRPAAGVLIQASKHSDKNVRVAAIRLLAEIAPEALVAESDVQVEMNKGGGDEDQRIIGWFEGIDLKSYLSSLQVFWCIGVVDRESLNSASPAFGYQKLTKELRKRNPTFNLGPLPTSIGYIFGTALPNLEGLFDREPFYSTWLPDERDLPLRSQSTKGARDESRWTRKAHKAWGYVDRFLALRGFLPRLTSASSQS